MSKKDPSPLVTPAGCQKVVYALILLIGLVQFAGGIGALIWASRTVQPPLDWRDVALSSLVATLFGGVGVGMLAGVALVRRHSRGTMPVTAPHDQPWLARSDWIAGKIHAAGGATFAAPLLAVVALWCTIAIFPLLSVLPTLIRTADSRWSWLTLLFPSVAFMLYAACGVQLLRARRFGVSIFEMASVPGVIGGQLGGVVRIPALIEAPDGFRLRLTCLELQRRGKDDSHEVAVWQEERLVTKLLDAGATALTETVLPVLFAIPYPVHESSLAGGKRDVRWLLDASAKLPGVDYHAQFEVPVFKTSESRRDFELDHQLAAEFAPPPDALRVLRDAGLRTEPLLDGGTRIVVPMARNWGSALLVTVVVAGMAAGVGFMIHFGAFFLWPILLALFASVFAYVALDLWFYRSTIDASPAGLTVRGGLCGLGQARRITPKEFTHVTSQEYMSSGRDVWYTIQVKPRKEKPITLAKGIRGKLLERAIIDTLETALARK